MNDVKKQEKANNNNEHLFLLFYTEKFTFCSEI